MNGRLCGSAHWGTEAQCVSSLMGLCAAGMDAVFRWPKVWGGVGTSLVLCWEEVWRAATDTWELAVPWQNSPSLLLGRWLRTQNSLLWEVLQGTGCGGACATGQLAPDNIAPCCSELLLFWGAL